MRKAWHAHELKPWPAKPGWTASDAWFYLDRKELTVCIESPTGVVRATVPVRKLASIWRVIREHVNKPADAEGEK